MPLLYVKDYLEEQVELDFTTNKFLYFGLL